LRKRREAAKVDQAAHAAREREAANRNAYERDRRHDANELFQTLTPEEQGEINAQATAYAASFGGSLRERMFATRRTQLTMVRHSDRLKTIEQWLKQRAA